MNKYTPKGACWGQDRPWLAYGRTTGLLGISAPSATSCVAKLKRGWARLGSLLACADSDVVHSCKETLCQETHLLPATLRHACLLNCTASTFVLASCADAWRAAKHGQDQPRHCSTTHDPPTARHLCPALV